MNDKLEMKVAQLVTTLDGKPESLTKAVDSLLEDEGVATPGSTVVLVDDSSAYPAGLSGKSKGASAKGSGYVDVELESGTVIQVPSNILLVKS